MLFLLLFLASGFFFKLFGQVTVGDGIPPLDVSILEVISKDSSEPGGLRLPQLTDGEVNILASYINQLPAAEKDRASGMMVFNTTISCTMVWNGKEFKSLCGDVSPSEMTVDCTNIKVYPGIEPSTTEYQQGLPIDGSKSYLEVPVTVTKSGTYKVYATTGNGYSFTVSGIFLDVGSYTLKLEGSGTPITGGDNPQYYDNLTLSVNDKVLESPCAPADLPQIPVKPAVGKAEYTITCNATEVHGTYTVGTQLNSTNFIKVRVNVTQTGFYSFSAQASGMRFVATGSWDTTGDKEVNLLPSGAPTTGGSIPITIKGEEAVGGTTCDKTINVVYRSIKILGYGTAAYQPTPVSTYSSRRIPSAEANFGVTGTVPTQNISYVNGAGYYLTTMLETHNPDIIVIGYPTHITSTSDANALANFLAKGGVLMAFNQENFVADALMINTICGSNITVAVPSGGGAGGNVYQCTDADHPILNGPFGDVRNLYWGEDAGTTCSVSEIPAGAIALAEKNTAFVYKNFLWIGDGGFIAGDAVNIDPNIFPCKINTNGEPIPKTGYRQNNTTVYNSWIYANALAWAIDYVQKNKQ